MIRGLLVAFLLAVIASSGVVFAAEMSAPLATMSGVADDELSALLDGGVTLRAVSGSLLNESSAEAFIVQDAEVEYDLIAAAGL
ncbi:MAG: hypothetical protein OEU86_03520, partial [Gammaproteobacteria bacterium]|nr:hypothetical protein [Gammaproteobacteria bacterium]